MSNWSIAQPWRRIVPHLESTIARSDINLESHSGRGGIAIHITEHMETRSDEPQLKTHRGDAI